MNKIEKIHDRSIIMNGVIEHTSSVLSNFVRASTSGGIFIMVLWTVTDSTLAQGGVLVEWLRVKVREVQREAQGFYSQESDITELDKEDWAEVYYWYPRSLYTAGEGGGAKWRLLVYVIMGRGMDTT